MTTTPNPLPPAPLSPSEIDGVLADDVIALVRRWVSEASAFPVDASARQLAGVLKDPRGLAFTVGFVDGVVRPEDLAVAARKLRELSKETPRFLPWYLRAAVRLGGAFAPVLPGVVVPLARAVLRRMVGHLVVDATDRRLGGAIRKIRTNDTRLNMNLLGEAVMGEKEAGRRLRGTLELLARDDVDYVSIKVSSTVAPHSPWAFEAAVAHASASLLPLFQLAASSSTPKFINLDMEEYKDLDLTIAVFTTILDRPELNGLEAGIVLQAYLPDALSAMIRLQEWAATRRAGGGAAVKVRIVKGANLPMERVEASLHDWPLATWSTKQETDTNYKRVVDYALRSEHIDSVRIGVAGHNLFDIAFAWLLAKRRGVERGVEFEMLLGMAQGQAEAVKREVGGLLLYTPVVHPQEFDVAIAYLIRRLEEGASRDNFMSAVFELSENEALFDREQQRFLSSLAELDDDVPGPNRMQDRTLSEDEPLIGGHQLAGFHNSGFHNSLDTDPSLPANRSWGAAILSRVPASGLGIAAIEAATITTAEQLDAVVEGAVAGGASWGALSGRERSLILHRAGQYLATARADLIEVMAVETGKTLDQADPEVSEAIDFAHYYAERAKELDTIDGARFVPAGLTLVTPPWNFPVAIPAGSTLAALAAGSAVIIKPAPQARRSGAVLVEALWAAGVPRDALRLVDLSESALGRTLVSHPSVDRVILTGGYETAELFRSFRQDLPLLAETSGKNAIVVTPSADLDLAVKDVVSSAFGHAGQKCSAASLVILVGSVARSRRFRNQLIDAAASLKTGYPADATTQLGPVIEPPSGKLLAALTTLEPGESWLVEPRRIDESGRLWSPGVKSGVRPGSPFHLTEYFGPVLGIMTAETLHEATVLQNQVDYGLTAGLHSLDAAEVRRWLETVQAGNLYVNRGITGAIVRRQPFGGWKKSSVGPGTKAGGPNYLFGLGEWRPAESTAVATDLPAEGPRELLKAAKKAGFPGDELAFLERALDSDASAFADEFGASRDVSQLTAERNVFRYRPVPVEIRLSEGGRTVELVRVAAAAVTAGSAVTVSVATALPEPVLDALRSLGVASAMQSDRDWLSSGAVRESGRIRLLGGSASDLAAATAGRPDLAVYAGPVTESGRIELLPFVREQAISITAHRFGTPTDLAAQVLS